MRHHALSALDTKRGHSAGAALFAILPQRRDHSLLRLLVAYETIWDFLDTTSEHAPQEHNGRQLHLSLIDALAPTLSHSSYYLHHPWQETRYLPRLVESCRTWCLELPGFKQTQAALIAEAWLGQVLALNHVPDVERREVLLQQWADTEAPRATDLAWYELGAAASASLTIHALLALASEKQNCSAAEIERVRGAYNPWISAATTMLDSFVDQIEDPINGDHSYVAHYPSPRAAVLRTHWLIGQSIERAQRLANGERHALIVAAMAAMYLSKDSARGQELGQASRMLARSGGRLTPLLLPLVRLWRIAYRQRAA